MFLNASSFRVNVSNKGKLLYFTMIINADDKGFVDTTNNLIQSLNDNDKEFRNEINMQLLDNDYTSALQELIEKGYVYEFRDNHNNKIHLIRHWFLHNKLVKGLWTNYGNFSAMVELKNNEYHKKPLKENNINQENTNQDITNQDNIGDEELMGFFKDR